MLFLNFVQKLIAEIESLNSLLQHGLEAVVALLDEAGELVMVSMKKSCSLHNKPQWLRLDLSRLSSAS